RLYVDGHADASFDPGSGANGDVNALAVALESKIVVGGAFNTINGMSRNRIARLNNDGSVDLTFDPGDGPSASVWCVSIQRDGKVLIGGTFQFVNGIQRNHIARLNSDGNLDTNFEIGS